MGKNVAVPIPPNYAQAATDQTAANTAAAITSANLSNPNYETPTFRRTVNIEAKGATPAIPATFSRGYDQDGTWVPGEELTPYIPATQGVTQPDIKEAFRADTEAGRSSQEALNRQLENEALLANVAKSGIQLGGGILAKNFIPLGSAALTSQTITPTNQGPFALRDPSVFYKQENFTGSPSTPPLLGAPENAGPAGSVGYLGSISNNFTNTLADARGLRLGDYAAEGGIGSRELQTELGGRGGLDYGPSAGQYGLASGGPAGPNLSGTLDQSRVAAMPVTSGMTAEQAINSRLEPQIARNRVSTETGLLNQGLRPGGEAYNSAINLLGQQENDQRIQAALQGLNLQMAANQQGFGQAQTLNDIANQAEMQRYGAGISGSQLSNAAINQNYGQGVQSAQIRNAAQQQGFGQQLQAGDFGNQAQLASFGMGLQDRNLANQSQAQNYQQAFQNLNSQNQAAGQNYAQNLGMENFRNASQLQGAQQAVALQELRNAAIGQNQQANFGLQSSQNAANSQAFAQQMSQQNFNNQAAQQNYANQVNYADARNQTQAAQFAQQLSSAQYAQAAQQQALSQQLQLRQLPLNEITALMSGQQIQNPVFPSYQGMTAAAGNIQQAIQQQGAWDQNVYNQKVASANAMVGAIGSLGGAALGGFGSLLGGRSKGGGSNSGPMGTWV